MSLSYRIRQHQRCRVPSSKTCLSNHWKTLPSLQLGHFGARIHEQYHHQWTVLVQFLRGLHQTSDQEFFLREWSKLQAIQICEQLSYEDLLQKRISFQLWRQ